MKNIIDLVFTPLDERISKNKKKYYAGPWSTSIKNYNFINYFDCRWKVKKVRDKDYKYLNNLHDRFLKILSEYFNNFHKTNYQIKYWEIIISVWLSNYLAALFYRFKIVEKVLKKKNYNIFLNKKNINFLTTNNSIEFYEYIGRSDYFNTKVFNKIKFFFKIQKKLKTKISYFDHPEEEKKSFIRIKNFSFLYFIVNNILGFLNFFSKKNKILLTDGFSLKSFLFLNYKLNQIPISINLFFNRELEIRSTNFNYQKRKKKIKKKIKSKDLFFNFIYENIFFDIPKIFLEDFKKNLYLVNSYNIDCKKIFSGTGHVNNDLFKIWLSNKTVLQKIPLYIICHGGDHTKYHGLFGYEDRISFKNLKWLDSNNHLPAAKYLGFSFSRSEKKKYLLLVLHEINPYPCKIDDAPVSIKELKINRNLNLLRANLKKNVYEKLLFAPKYMLCKKFQHEVSENLNAKKILKPFEFSNKLKEAKIVLCNYPQTAFIDAFRTGPTILVLEKDQWRPIKYLEDVYKEMKKNKIIFSSTESAISHINNIWDNVDSWWNAKEVLKIRLKFLKKINCEKNNYSDWIEFLKK